METPKPIVLVVLDGWGESTQKRGNALLNAKLPTTEMLDANYPKILLQASGIAVGLPWGECGNSEVGHQTMGTGQIIYQNLPRITRAIEDGTIFTNKTLVEAAEWTRKHNSALHFFGLLSDGAVHAHIDHLFAMLEFAKEQNVAKVFVHVITDGRDTAPNIADKYVGKLQQKLDKLELGKIASVAGRYYTMDRNDNWDRVEKGYEAMVAGKGIQETDAIEAIKKQYQKEVYDEMIEPVVIVDEKGQPVGQVADEDAVIFFNYREDRARMIAKAFCDDEFDKFPVAHHPEKIFFAGMVEYEKGLPKQVIFPMEEIKTCLGKALSEKQKRQLRIAETEKYAHVTYFFNGGREKAFDGEDHILVESKKVPSYAEIPEMSAEEITQKLLGAIGSGVYDFILVNYANPDMVGHTGDMPASIKAVEKVDECLGRVIEVVLKQQGLLLITADHGNVEELVNLKTGEKDTEHSTNPVPCWLVTPSNNKKGRPNMATAPSGILCDIAPTILELFGIPKPDKLQSESLLPFLADQTETVGQV